MSYRGRISVFGGRVVSEELFREAERLGAALGREGYLVFCGGGNGVMEAVSKGVASVGGTVIGLLKGATPEEGNDYLTIPVYTNLGVTRNALIAMNCDVAIAIGGKYGTLSEIAYAFQFGKPVLGFHTWEIDGVRRVESVTEMMTIIHELCTNEPESD